MLHSRTQEFVSAHPGQEPRKPVIQIRGFTQYFGSRVAIEDITLDVQSNEVLCIIGRHGAGKTSFLRSLNRTNEDERGARSKGEVLWKGQSIYDPRFEVSTLRRKIALVPRIANPFPGTVLENMAYGIKLHRLATSPDDLEHLAAAALSDVQLLSLIENNLSNTDAYALPLQQQRLLCIARALVLQPEILLLDEPPEGLGGIPWPLLERLLERLKPRLTVIVTTNSLKTAAVIADRIAHIEDGKLLELDNAELVLTEAQNPITRAFVNSYC